MSKLKNEIMRQRKLKILYEVYKKFSYLWFVYEVYYMNNFFTELSGLVISFDLYAYYFW